MKLNIALFTTVFVAAGKVVAKSNLSLVASHGTVSVADAQFAGRRKGEFGEFISLRNADGGLLFISLDKGCPAGCGRFEVKEFVATADYEKMHEGDHVFKAFAIVEEEE